MHSDPYSLLELGLQATLHRTDKELRSEAPSHKDLLDIPAYGVNNYYLLSLTTFHSLLNMKVSQSHTRLNSSIIKCLQQELLQKIDQSEDWSISIRFLESSQDSFHTISAETLKYQVLQTAR